MKRFATIVGTLLVLSSTVLGQDADLNQSKSWEIRLAPYIFFGSVNGDATVGIVGPSEVDADFSDILKNLQFALMLHGEVHKGKWGLVTDFIYLKLGSDISTPIGGVLDAEVRESILEVFANHRVKKDWGWIDIYGGIRWWDIGVDLKLDGLVTTEVNRDEGWVDPVIGARVFYKSNGKLIAGLRADIGGFGAGSDFSFNIQPGIGYQFSDLFTLMLQYKYLDADYDNGEEGRDFFGLNAATHGPLLGFIFQF